MNTVLEVDRLTKRFGALTAVKELTFQVYERVPLFTLAGRSIGLYDILPPTHAVVALNKVMTLGAGPGEVADELGALLVLSALYLAFGVWLFQRTHLKAA